MWSRPGSPLGFLGGSTVRHHVELHTMGPRLAECVVCARGNHFSSVTFVRSVQLLCPLRTTGHGTRSSHTHNATDRVRSRPVTGHARGRVDKPLTSAATTDRDEKLGRRLHFAARGWRRLGRRQLGQRRLGRRRLGWPLGRPQGGSAPRCGGESAAIVTRPSGEGRTGDRGRWLG